MTETLNRMAKKRVYIYIYIQQKFKPFKENQKNHKLLVN